MKLFTILMAAVLSVCAVLYPSAQKEGPAVETTPAVVTPVPQMQAPVAVPLKSATTQALEEKQEELPMQEMEELQEKLPPKELEQYNMTAESVADPVADPPIEEPVVMEEPATVVDATVIVEHAKTGYEGEDNLPVAPLAPEPEEPAPSTDVSEAIAAAEAFAVETYHVVIDETLDFTNSAYRFPAAAPWMADQDFLNCKAVDIVDFTFQQMIRRNGISVEEIRESGIRCRVYVEQTDHDYLIYCFYA